MRASRSGRASREMAGGRLHRRVAEAVLVGAVPPLMLKTAANPGGQPIKAFAAGQQPVDYRLAPEHPSAPSRQDGATWRLPDTVGSGVRPRPTSGDPPQPGHPTEAKGGPPPGRSIGGRSRARRGYRWGTRGRGAGGDHDQAGRFQAARARPDGQDRRVVRDRPQQAPRRAPGHDARRLPDRLDARGAARQQRRRHRRAGDGARAARDLLARRPARGAGARGRAGTACR